MLDFLELEETVGRAWHRVAGDTRSFPSHPDAAVRLAGMRPVLGPFFRALGGEGTVEIAPARAKSSMHRLRFRQFIGLGEERIAESARDGRSLMLPEEISLFPDPALNRDLYLWLAAFMARMPLETGAAGERNALEADLAHIVQAGQTTAEVLEEFPGLVPLHRRLAAALLAGRRRGALPRAEQRVEDRIRHALAVSAGLQPSGPPEAPPVRMPPGYLPMLAVPLWPRLVHRAETAPRGSEDRPQQGFAAGEDGGRKSASREDPERRSERSPFFLNRFEKILSLSEMIGVDRPADDTGDDTVKTADDLEDMVLGERRGKPASRFRFDLDLPPEAVDRGRLEGEFRYPEWDYRSQSMLEDQVVVRTGTAAEPADGQVVPEDARPLIRRVRRQFEILRPKNILMRGQLDGAELDLDQLIRRQADLAAGTEGTDRIHLLSRPRDADLAVTLLVDVSLSTDAWVDNRRVIDVEKEALLVLAHGLSACGDRHSILTFTSRRRDDVRVETVKDFGEALSPRVEARIAGLKPGYYTRMGAAIRHAAARLKAEPNSRRLLLILTDGKPNDVDYYEGRYALEDTSRAVREARRAGLSVFAVTVDRQAVNYLPSLFGQRGFAVIPSLKRLPSALPAIYRSLAG